VDAVRRFELMTFDPHVVRRQAERFSQQVFRREMSRYVAEEWAKFRS